MVIDSKILPSTTYPWFFFYRIARLTLVVFLPTLFLILFLYRSSYKSGLVTQISEQFEEDLQLLIHTVGHSSLDWKGWCESLPSRKTIQYELIQRNKVLCRNGKPIEGDLVTATHEINKDLRIVKQVPLTVLKESMSKFDRILFLRIVPFALLSYFIFIFLFYRSTKPLGVILSKVEKFKGDIPFTKSLSLLYQRDEWAAIEEALNKADQRLQKQVTDVREENEKNSAILEAINDAIIAVDKFESILFFNSKFQKNFIKESEGKEIHKKVWHIFSDEVLDAFRSVLKSGEPRSLKGMNFPESHSPGRYFDLNITPLNSSSGITTGALGVFYDVTDFKLTEQMRVDFVANVSHEIRTPLTSIKGFTQILQNQSAKVDPSLLPFLEKIVANTERMISLFNDLLSLSVIESRNHLRFEEFNVGDIVDTVESNILASYPEKKVIFENDIQLEYLKGDFRLIEQVILNLCDNACKYSGDSVTINIATFEKDGMAWLKIKDNGPGIAKEHLSRIFERFYRVDASRESLRGTGLGLSIVKQIVTKHNGKIRAESDGPGKGTTFIIQLPLN